MPQISVDELKPMISDAATEFGIPEDSLWRKLRAENSGSPDGAARLSSVRTDAVSPKQAKGVMQLTQPALDDVINAGLIPAGTTLDSLSPKDNIRVSAAYIKRLREYSTEPAVEDAMYNFGPKARFRMDQLPAETSDYLKKSGATMADSTSPTSPTPALPSQGMDTDSLVQMLLQSTRQQNQMMQSAGNEISLATKAGFATQQKAIQDQQEVIANAATNATAKAAVQYQNDKLVENLQSLFHMNPDDANNEIATSLAAAQSAREARVSARAEYDQARQINPLTNPLDFLFAQIKLPQLAAKNNALADQEDLALQNINDRTAQLKNAKSTITANTADQLQTINKNQAENDAKMANAKLEQEAGKLTVQSATTRLQETILADKIGDNTRNMTQVIMSAQDREEMIALRREAMEARLKDKKTADEEEARINGRLNTVSQSLGMAEPMTLKRMKLLKPEERQVWERAALTGQFGTELQDSLKFYLSNGNRAAIVNGGGTSTYSTAKKLEQAGAEYLPEAEREFIAKNPQAKRPTLDQARGLGYDMYENLVKDSTFSPTSKADLSSSKWDKTFNPYKANFVGFSSAIDTFPQLAMLKTNPVKQAVDDLVKAGAVTGDNLTASQQQQVLGSVVQNVLARKTDLKKAASDVASYFSGAAEYNSSMNNYNLFGLPKQTNYLYTLDGSLDLDRQKVDLMNSTSVENALMKMVREHARSAAPGATPFGFR